MQPPVSSFRRRGMTTSPRSSVNFTGLRQRSGLNSNSLSLCTDVCTGLRHHTSLTNLAVRLIRKPDVDFARRHHHYWSFVEHVCLLSAIGHFRSSLLASGTVCHSTSPRRLLFKSSDVVSRLIFFLLLFLNYFINVQCLRGDFSHS